MSKGIFFNLPGASGHINPSLGMVSELVKQGEQVIYYAGSDSAERIRGLGATFRTYEPYFYYQHSAEEATDLVSLLFKIMELCEQSVAHLKKDLHRDKPDYIIYDSCCMWGKYLAKCLDIPAICSITTLVSTPWVVLSDRLMLSMLIRKVIANIPNIGPGRQRMHYMLESLGIPHEVSMKALFHGIFDLMQNEGDLNVVFLPRRYQPFNSRLKSSYKFVGASVPEGRDVDDLHLQRRIDQPLIYISLGTVHNMRDTFYRQCMEAFGDMPYQVVMSVGQRTDIATLGAIPANFIVRNRVPQLEVLKQADVFISHGGMNSINESLYYDVPLIMVPQQEEQLFNARRIAHFGAGLYLDAKFISPQKLRGAVQRILTHKHFHRNASLLGQDSRAGGGHLAAAQEILHLVGTSQPLLQKAALAVT